LHHRARWAPGAVPRHYTLQDAQKCRPHHPSFVSRDSLVEDPDEIRFTIHASRMLSTPLADFFRILLARIIHDSSSRNRQGTGLRPAAEGPSQQ